MDPLGWSFEDSSNEKEATRVYHNLEELVFGGLYPRSSSLNCYCSWLGFGVLISWFQSSPRVFGTRACLGTNGRNER